MPRVKNSMDVQFIDTDVVTVNIGYGFCLHNVNIGCVPSCQCLNFVKAFPSEYLCFLGHIKYYSFWEIMEVIQIYFIFL